MDRRRDRPRLIRCRCRHRIGGRRRRRDVIAPRQDRVPTRTCIGCRRRAPQPELVRTVRRPDGFVVVGPTLEGRGAWLCRGATTCLAEATKRKAFSRAFRAPITGILVSEDDLGSEPPTRSPEHTPTR
ncbi:MAG: YlxR family protein [Acidimicrobiales bacterium]